MWGSRCIQSHVKYVYEMFLKRAVMCIWDWWKEVKTGYSFLVSGCVVKTGMRANFLFNTVTLWKKSRCLFFFFSSSEQILDNRNYFPNIPQDFFNAVVSCNKHCHRRRWYSLLGRKRKCMTTLPSHLLFLKIEGIRLEQLSPPQLFSQCYIWASLTL